jgi:cytochrome c-type biogenesis protein
MESLSIYNVAVAVLGGVLSFLSPCVLPLVPSYISLISGVSVENLKGEESNSAKVRRAVIFNSLAFIAGISMIFLFLGATAGLIGAAVFNNFWVRLVGGLVIIFFGLQMMGLLRFSAYYKDTRFLNQTSGKSRGVLGSFVLGLAFAAGWTPCIGPMMSGIIILSATSGWQGGLILSAFYAVGLALPFLFVGLLFERFLSFYKNFRRHLNKVEIASGALLILMGLLVASGSVSEISRFAVQYLPDAGEYGLKLDTPKQNQPLETAGGENKVAAAPNQNFPDAPAFVFQTLDGKTMAIGELRGRVVLLNLWATYCVPCRTEIPDLSDLQKTFEAEGLSVVGVTYDDTAAQARDFQRTIKMEYTVALGKEPSANELFVALPVTFVIDRNGKLRQKIVGKRSREDFEAIIKPLLAEKSTATL